MGVYSLNIKHKILDLQKSGGLFKINLDNADLEYISSQKMSSVEIKNAVVTYQLPHTAADIETTHFPGSVSQDPNTTIGTSKQITNSSFNTTTSLIQKFDSRLHTPLVIVSNSIGPNKIHRSNCKSDFIIQEAQVSDHDHSDDYANLMSNAIYVDRPLISKDAALIKLQVINNQYELLVAAQTQATTQARLTDIRHFINTTLPEDSKIGRQHQYNKVLAPFKSLTTSSHRTYSQNTASFTLSLDINVAGSSDTGIGNTYYFSELYVEINHSGDIKTFYVGKMLVSNWAAGNVLDAASFEGGIIAKPTPDTSIDGSKAVLIDSSLSSAAPGSTLTHCGVLKVPQLANNHEFKGNVFFHTVATQEVAGAKAAFDADTANINTIDALRLEIKELEKDVAIPEILVSHDTHDVIATVNTPVETPYTNALTFKQSQSQKFECSPPRYSQLEFSIRPMFTSEEVWRQNAVGSVEISFDIAFC
tara:strand:- start:2511 stop:3938 length:1428 start_codon:yes stop_codon:yes gene_type:complete